MAPVEDPYLQSCSTCGAEFDASDHEPLSAILCPVCGAPYVVAARIDQFELQEEIGRGGMGVVYRALDTSLRRLVALKLIRKKKSKNHEEIAQLEKEAKVTASISHPHVVKVFTTGTDHGRFYIAMELVSKGTLGDLIEKQGRVAELQVLETGIQIAEGLRAAQEASLIHRDVKPGNILYADTGAAKIVDFGLAVALGEEIIAQSEIWGTPYYIAPEKLDKKPEDFRSDIYSLGGTLFHALAGRPPFEAKNATMVALKHLKSQAVSLQAFAPWVSNWTSYAINRTLNKDPDQRFQSYDELIEHLEYARSELQAAGGKAPEPKRIVIETEKDKKTMGLIVSGMIGLIVLLGVSAFVFRDTMFGSAKTPKLAEAPVEEKVEEMFPEAREKLAEKDAAGAAAAFREAARRPNLAQPKLNWASLLEGLSESAAGQVADANATFKQIQQRGPFSKKPEDQALASFFLTASKHMIDEGAIDPSATANVHGANYEAILPLLYAVKDWKLGNLDDAITLFRQFRQFKPVKNDAWISSLTPLASSPIEEFTEYQMAADRYNNAKTASARKSAVAALGNVKGAFEKRAQALIAKEPSNDEKPSPMPASGKISEATYHLLNRRSGKVVDAPNNSRNDGSQLIQFSLNNGTNQRWKILPAGGDAYLIIGVGSGKALNVPESETADGIRITLNSLVNSPSERWKIESVDGGYYKVIAECSGKALSIGGDPLKDTSPLIQTTYTGAQEQQWKLEAQQ